MKFKEQINLQFFVFCYFKSTIFLKIKYDFNNEKQL